MADRKMQVEVVFEMWLVLEDMVVNIKDDKGRGWTQWSCRITNLGETLLSSSGVQTEKPSLAVVLYKN